MIGISISSVDAAAGAHFPVGRFRSDVISYERFGVVRYQNDDNGERRFSGFASLLALKPFLMPIFRSANIRAFVLLIDEVKRPSCLDIYRQPAISSVECQLYLWPITPPSRRAMRSNGSERRNLIWQASAARHDTKINVVAASHTVWPHAHRI